MRCVCVCVCVVNFLHSYVTCADWSHELSGAIITGEQFR